MENLKYDKILVISDNPFLINAFCKLTLNIPGVLVDFACTKGNVELLNDPSLAVKITPLNVKNEHEAIALQYDLIFSLHCKQLFPTELVRRVKCINVHPGYNPYNRGWFPQVFSILNNMPAGVTIHEIDEDLDHGPIIARRQIKINSWETSFDVYKKIQVLEVELLKECLPSILRGTYKTTMPEEDGNVNLKRDFNGLCKLDLEKTTTIKDAINQLRALTHGNYANAFFIDPESGSKVYVKISLQKED
jgi:methionyl-tRNA formyltransferase